MCSRVPNLAEAWFFWIEVIFHERKSLIITEKWLNVVLGKFKIVQQQ